MSLRGAARPFGVSRNTLATWIKKAADLPALHTTVLPAEPSGRETPILELDEVWSFVGSHAHPVWIWIALCRRTRQVVAYAVGDRSAKTCRKLWQAIPASYRQGTSYSDFGGAYNAVVPDDHHRAVGKETGETAHIEWWNNTLRQRLS